MSDRMVDHLVLAVTRDEQQQLTERLWEAGFPEGDLVRAPSVGLLSRLVPMAGGGFVELSCAIEADASPVAGFFDRTPRLLGVSYTTMDAAADLAAWRAAGNTEAFAAAGSWYREDGTPGFYVGAAPVAPGGEPYYTVQERRLFPLPYPEHAATAPALVRIEAVGAGAAAWCDGHRRWLGLEDRAGGTELVCTDGDHASLELYVTFRVERGAGTVPLACGAIELVA